MARASELYDSLHRVRRQKHDTLYCTLSQFRYFLDEIDGPMGNAPTGDDILIEGLEVIIMDRLHGGPIVCKKGDVFPYPRDYQ